MIENLLKKGFPLLENEPFQLTSPRTPEYNCIAWAASANDRWFWPDENCYWPPGIAKKDTLAAFKDAFAVYGYTEVTDEEWEESKEKVAIYASGDSVKHMARQISPEYWTSKLGREVDISHTLRGLEGDSYGLVVCILARENRQ